MENRRPPNRRGEGSKLRDEILQAARALVDDGGEAAVTLRAVARSIGIAAPSIYAHFPDRDAILDALVDEAFDELSAAVSSAISAETQPVARLRAGCAAYLDVATRHPNSYRLAFADREANALPRAGASRAFEFLVDAVHACIEIGASTSDDAFGNATAIWVALHGYATMHTSRPAFPWPPTQATLELIVTALAGLDHPPNNEDARR
jgi:AcrR family transcriptional regulator